MKSVWENIGINQVIAGISAEVSTIYTTKKTTVNLSQTPTLSLLAIMILRNPKKPVTITFFSLRSRRSDRLSIE